MYPGVARALVNLVRRPPVPSKSLGIILRNVNATLVSDANDIFRVGGALIRGEAIPLERFTIILRHTASKKVSICEIVLGQQQALIRRKMKPFHRLGVVPLGAQALLIQNPDFTLR